MYSIYADGVCIYNDVFSLDNMKVVNPKLTLEDSAAGSLEMTLPPTNAAYDTIVRMVTDISVKKNGEEVWAGRALSESRDFWNNRVLYCEGELAFFNDSVQPPAEYAGKSVREYLDQLIAVHNGQVGENRRFAIGAVTVVDEAFPTYYTNYGKTLESLNALVEAYGGHLRVRTIRAVLTPEMRRIIDRWGNPDDGNPGTLIFKFATGKEDGFATKHLVDTVIQKCNKVLGRIAEAVGLPPVTTYSARHSFATVLKRSGTNISYISESLGHSNLAITENYLASFERDERMKNAQLLTKFD